MQLDHQESEYDFAFSWLVAERDFHRDFEQWVNLQLHKDEVKH